MKRLVASIALLLIITSYLLSCEKDDLCADGTPTTPGLVINFYKKNSSDVANTIQKLYFHEVGSEKRDSIINSAQLILPLRSDAEIVKFALENVTTPTGSTTPTISTAIFEIKYTHTQTYISRACGYKSTFILTPGTLELPNPGVTSDVPDTDPWFLQSDINVITSNIEIQDEKKPHINIYF